MKSLKYKIIILPPDHHHLTMRDTFDKGSQYVSSIYELCLKLNYTRNQILVKYRTNEQKNNYYTHYKSETGYGLLKNYLHKDVIVIGPPGSGTIECLLNDLQFYTYEDYNLISRNKSVNLQALDQLHKILYIADNIKNLEFNMLNKLIYKKNKSKKNLTFDNSYYTKQIVEKILNKKK
tara:strand:- start:16876 stop:17409 length:534 start_codon:yes stop_codon:yes gene_type:complete